MRQHKMKRNTSCEHKTNTKQNFPAYDHFQLLSNTYQLELCSRRLLTDEIVGVATNSPGRYGPVYAVVANLHRSFRELKSTSFCVIMVVVGVRIVRKVVYCVTRLGCQRSCLTIHRRGNDMLSPLVHTTTATTYVSTVVR